MSPVDIIANISEVRARIASAAKSADRDPKQVTLLAVSKTQPASAIRAAFNAGLSQFGENYVQEALVKMVELQELPIEWHFIGPLQSNKTRAVAEHFDWVHSVDRLKIAQRLSDQRPQELPPLQVCLQVNISGEDSKSGASPEEALALALAMQALPRLTLRGLMAIPAAQSDDPAKPFASLAALMATLSKEIPQLDTLSMGMSADLAPAISQGATIVRVGTDLFGARHAR
jgi:pyridoxal phosphate enzyme (YggS family)